MPKSLQPMIRDSATIPPGQEHPRLKLLAANGFTVALLAAAFPLASPAAHALPQFPLAPACSSYSYNSPAMEVAQDNNVTVVVDKSGDFFSGNAGYTQNGSGVWTNGTAVGRISGRNITVDFKWNNGLTTHWDGYIDDDLTARGTAKNSEGAVNTWSSKAKFDCVPAAAPPAQSSGPVNDPPPLDELTATVNADTDLYDKANDDGDAVVIGQLNVGQVVKVQSACSPNAWCFLVEPKGAAWGRDLTNN
ncbi:hypothetical protein HZU38_03305 [Mycolicibacterium vanbaalenii]|uniref:hypothetical protein n=1 Tax=Mycolicibacterium vanbaalenii TaxID=110539 RepID=UPI001F452D45|nr:hypothetical protein [Mycolicibacterium vanbaalenii]UJL29565.1 hypothetical protein HZU38_03305 [Mycolicibacterium vanbaalenii]WND57396.1 hypothetical protein QQA43_02965 [Mycolicibacterium vanbaalenii]